MSWGQARSVMKRRIFPALQPIKVESSADIKKILNVLTSKLNLEHRRLTDEEIINIFSENLIYTTRGTFLLDDVLACSNQDETLLAAPDNEITLIEAKANPKKLILNRPVAKCLFEVYQNQYTTFPYHFTAPKNPKTGLPIIMPQLNIFEECIESDPELHLRHPNKLLQDLISLRFSEYEREFYNNDKLVKEIDERLQAYENIIKRYQDFYDVKTREIALFNIFLKDYEDLQVNSKSEIQQLNSKAENEIKILKKKQKIFATAAFITTLLLAVLAIGAVITCPLFITIPIVMYATLVIGPIAVIGLFSKAGNMIIHKVNSYFENKVAHQQKIQERIKNYFECKPKIKVLKTLAIRIKSVIEDFHDCSRLLRELRGYFIKDKNNVTKLSECKTALLLKPEVAKIEGNSDSLYKYEKIHHCI